MKELPALGFSLANVGEEYGARPDAPIPVVIETGRGLLVSCLRATGRKVYGRLAGEREPETRHREADDREHLKRHVEGTPGGVRRRRPGRRLSCRRGRA